MTPQERDLLSNLFQRLRQAETVPRDPEAERYIVDSVRAQPVIPYLLTQMALVQEHALNAAQQRIQDLEHELAATKAAAQQPAPQPSSGGSFLGGLLGGIGPWGPRPQPSAPPPQASAPRYPAAQQSYAAAPAGYPPQQGGYAQPQAAAPSGGFLRGAMQTAAGVAGGALAFEAIQGLFHGGSGPFGGGMGHNAGFDGGQSTIVDETVVNNYYGDRDDADTRYDGPDNSADTPYVDNVSSDNSFDGGSDFDGGSSDFGGSDDSFT